MTRLDNLNNLAPRDNVPPLRPRTLDEVPERVRQIAMLRGLGYSYRQIAGPLNVTPQAVSLMLARHRRALKSLRGAMELSSLSARAVNVLGRHGVRTREQARQANLLECLDRERNCGRKTLDEIARWIAEEKETSIVAAGLNGSAQDCASDPKRPYGIEHRSHEANDCGNPGSR